MSFIINEVVTAIIQDCVQKAQAAERERCAKIASEHADTCRVRASACSIRETAKRYTMAADEAAVIARKIREGEST